MKRTDTERLEWIFQQDVVIGTFAPPGWKNVLFALYQKTMPIDLVDGRIAIDAAMDAEGRG
ncbi:hypothetical protein [Gluconobacter oxydans]|uniref:hypothetical protein n=1 Tax=Gluconobacter oxydans TaxID=442 RepID=UPI0007827327|nr:hypothetical protein [Gluconobacter oxydans]KXV12593.1 hypothetical protein AD932_06700 [Gluconobacter oxydans]